MGKGRKPCCDKAVVKKGPWSQVEDYKLISFVQKHGHDNWRALPKLAGLARCGKSCRLRWVNYLRPDVKRGDFTLDEEEIIIKLHEELGNKWSKIASKLPGRTDNEIKNIWNTHLKKRIMVKDSTMESQSESSTSLPTSTSSNEGLDRSTIDDCSETKPSLQTSSIDDTMEQSTSSTSFNQETEDLNSIFGDLGSPNPNMAESIRDHDDKGDKGNSLEDLVEIPFEPDIDLWYLLDGDQPYSVSPSGEVDPNDQSNNNMNDAKGEERWWLVYLENELGLDHHETRSPQSTIS